MSEQLFLGTHLVSATIIFVFLALLIKLCKVNSRWVWNPIFCVCVLAYNVRVLTAHSYPVLAEFINVLEFLAPIVFIVCIRVNFQDPFFIGLIERVALGVLLPILLISKTLNSTNDISEEAFFWLVWAPYLISLICVFSAFWVAVKDWATDLVDKRRQLRQIFVFGFSPLILIALTLHALALIYPINALEYNSAIALIYGFGAFSLILIGGYLEPDWLNQLENVDNDNIPSKPSPSGSTIENAIGNPYAEELRALDNAMSMQKYYKQTGLTMSQLSGYLEYPEYRVRKAINQGLSFRNFKSFLNQYRVLDAAEQLKKDHSKSVLNISIDAGFNGLSTFNRAFKDHFGMTPSEFRNKVEPSEQ